MAVSEKFEPIRRGLLEFLTLRIIAVREVYAADILKALSDTEFATQEGTLYPLLSKLRREGFVEYSWVESESGPPRKYYRLTPKGRGHLEETSDYWHKINQTIKKLGK
ncbi:MAG TPA: PadR family transcriptional regulator [Candidatus Paceibacterota bacterium]|nr:PadR family transcriptional regulator [Candidatus Paceibacterota bacterium]